MKNFAWKVRCEVGCVEGSCVSFVDKFVARVSASCLFVSKLRHENRNNWRDSKQLAGSKGKTERRWCMNGSIRGKSRLNFTISSFTAPLNVKELVSDFGEPYENAVGNQAGATVKARMNEGREWNGLDKWTPMEDDGMQTARVN